MLIMIFVRIFDRRVCISLYTGRSMHTQVEKSVWQTLLLPLYYYSSLKYTV